MRLSFPLVAGAVVHLKPKYSSSSFLRPICSPARRILQYLIARVGVISGNVIFGPPLAKYWAEKQQQDQAAKEDQTGST